MALSKQYLAHSTPSLLVLHIRIFGISVGKTWSNLSCSEKREVADALLADILVAFDKLDAVDKLPTIFCEANDLPSLVLDPVSQRLDNNSSILESLVKKIHDLPTAVPQSALNKQRSSLDSVICR